MDCFFRLELIQLSNIVHVYTMVVELVAVAFCIDLSCLHFII